MTDPSAAIRSARSLLFVPGNRPERFEKAVAAGADLVVVDLEDAVRVEDKDAARREAARWGSAHPETVVRVNAQGGLVDADLEAIAGTGCAVMLPKAEDPSAVAAVTGLGVPVIVLIETPRGVRRAAELLAVPGAERAAFGSIDFAAAIGVDPDRREALLLARSALVFASAESRRVPPVDGVTTAIDDVERIGDDMRYARSLGFTAKLAIHPRQLAPIHRALRPTEEESSWALRVLAAAGSGDAIAVEGRMVDAPVVARARAIVAQADRV